jgi:hypothetical protein
MTREEIDELPKSRYNKATAMVALKQRSEFLALPDESASSDDDEQQQSQANPEQTQCMVCLQGFQGEDQVRGLRCLHIFHACCIDNWLIKTAVCPICRVVQTRKRVVYTPRNRNFRP